MSQPERKQLKEAIHEASQWYARLNSGYAADSDVSAWGNWLEASAVNRQAWEKLEFLKGQLETLPKQEASNTLIQTDISRRNFIKGFGSLAALIPAAWIGYELTPDCLFRQNAICTAKGEQKRLLLPDGSMLVVNTDSEVIVRFDNHQRLVELERGEIYISTSSDPVTPPRPFSVRTRQGDVEALGTQFMVKASEMQTLASVLQDRIRVTSAEPLPPIELQSGQCLQFTENGYGDLKAVSPYAASWTQGSLVVVDTPLCHLINELSRYRKGYLTCDDAVKNLKVSGAFPINDTDSALNALAHSFPVRVHFFTPYWVRILPSEL